MVGNVDAQSPRAFRAPAHGQKISLAPMFGGSKETAMAGFRRAAELFDKEKFADPLLPDWGHPEAYAWNGVAYLDKNESANARAALERALAIAPDYGWVKNYRYPKATAAKQDESQH
jgi:tetratricopeptide (TPR) repeat protein